MPSFWLQYRLIFFPFTRLFVAMPCHTPSVCFCLIRTDGRIIVYYLEVIDPLAHMSLVPALLSAPCSLLG